MSDYRNSTIPYKPYAKPEKADETTHPRYKWRNEIKFEPRAAQESPLKIWWLKEQKK